MDDNKILDLAKKLKALADQGVDGEKENAAAMLQRLMEKHGITLESISDEVKRKRYFDIKTTQQKFFQQVASSVIGGGFSYFVSPTSKRRIGIELTDAQYIEIDAKFEFYIKAYEKDLDIFYRAFIHRNRLTAKPTENDTRPGHKMSEDDLKVLEMMRAMNKHEFQKRLSN